MQIVVVALLATACAACATLELETRGQDLSEDPTNVDALKRQSYGAEVSERALLLSGADSTSQESSRLLAPKGGYHPAQ